MVKKVLSYMMVAILTIGVSAATVGCKQKLDDLVIETIDETTEDVAEVNDKSEDTTEKKNNQSEDTETSTTESRKKNGKMKENDDSAETTTEKSEKTTENTTESTTEKPGKTTEETTEETTEKPGKTTEETTEEPKHTHSWEKVTKTVHHDEEYHYEDKEVKTYHIGVMCTVCYKKWCSDCLGSQAEECANNHIRGKDPDSHWQEFWREDIQAYDKFPYGSWQTCEVEHITTEKVKVVDKEAWDEEVITGWKCKGCGKVVNGPDKPHQLTNFIEKVEANYHLDYKLVIFNTIR